MVDVQMESVIRKRVRFEEGPPAVHIIPRNDAEQSTDPADPTDPAAAKRSQQRREYPDMHTQEDTALLDDVEEAEEDYEDPEEAFNEVGVPIEPFHLKREREEGYFDAEGNYIQYRLDDEHDAWLDSVAEQNVQLDPATESRRRQAAARAAEREEQEAQMDADEKLVLKQRVLQLLQPGESVLDALRRLAGRTSSSDSSHQRGPRRQRRPQAAVAGGTEQHGSGEAEQQQQRKASSTGSPRGNGVHGANSGVPPENREAFDRLTEYSDALLGTGEFGIYSMSREQMERGIAQHRARAAAAQDLRHVTAAQEALLRDLAPQGAQGLEGQDVEPTQQGGALSEPPGTATRDPDMDMFAGDVEPAVADAPAEHRIGAAVVQAGAAAAARFGDAGGSGRGSPEQSAPGASDLGPAPMDLEFAASDAYAEPTGTASSSGGEGYSRDSDGGSAHTEPSGLEGYSDPAVQDVLTGFVLDESSGYWYSSDLGCYYDPGTQLFGDASSGMWYKYDAGQYEVAM